MTASDNAAQLGPVSTWGKSPRELAASYNPDEKGIWARQSIEKAAVELAQKLASRSEFRASDDFVDTLAGFVLNIDGRVDEFMTVYLAVELGYEPAIEKLKAKPDSALAKAALAKIGK